MSDIISLLNQGLSPLMVILIVLLVYVLNELKNKINKVDQIDSLIAAIEHLVRKLDGLVETQKESKKDTDGQIKELRDDLSQVIHRLVKVETVLELESED